MEKLRKSTNQIVLDNNTISYFRSIRIISTLLATSGFVSNVKAQVQYTDVNPDFVLPYTINSAYLLDLNNDGITDFKLGLKSSTWLCDVGGAYGPWYYGGQSGLMLENVGMFSGNQIRLESITSCNSFFNKVKNMQVATLLQFNSFSLYNIGSSPWNAILGGYSGCSSPCSVTNPLNVDMYVGLRLELLGAHYLGWMRILLTNSTVIIKDYAYEAMPFQPIIIGATNSSVGLNDIESTSRINLNGKNLAIQFFNESAKYNIRISNLTGQVIESSDNVNLLWNFSFDQPGVYMVTISNETGKFTKKLFVF